MLLPLNWLKDYVDFDIDALKLADELTLTGTKAETVNFMGKEIQGVSVGKVIQLEKHPDADELSVAKLDTGDKKVTIVTSAKNLKIGDYVPVALTGAILPGGKKIESVTMRGIKSDGMMCSLGELGIENKYLSDEEKSGIYVLDEPETLGKDIKEVLNLNDAVIEFELTANRPDCNSIIGMARETAATLKKTLKLPDNTLKEEGDTFKLKAVIENHDMCERYMLREVTDVKIGKSPYFIRERLIKSGIRPINNIVDLTNYVMIEYGQPLHAFDRNAVKGDTIRVGNVTEENTFTTLDGQERKIDSSMIFIKDGEKPIALGGVMGGENSMINSDTDHIIIESACFNSEIIRQTSKKLSLRSDASIRYEKGIDPVRCEYALDRICSLIERLGIGKVCKGKADVHAELKKNSEIKITSLEINSAIGTSMDIHEMENILNRLYFKVENKGEELTVTAPFFRTDIEQKADIVEEIARMYGFKKIKAAPIYGEILSATESDEYKFEKLIKSEAMKAGLNEMLSYSFVSSDGVKKCRLTDERYLKYVKILNPLGEETSVMRTSLVPNMMQIVETNVSAKNETFYGFEYGTVFFDDKIPVEEKSMVIATYGKYEDFFTLKARVNSILKNLRFKNFEYLPVSSDPYFHPGKCADVIIDETPVLRMGEVHPSVLENYGIKTKVYVGVFNIPEIYKLYNPVIKYESIIRFPALEHDIALVADEDINVGKIEKAIKSAGGDYLEKIHLFDIYRGKSIPEGKKSVAYSLYYRKPDGTMTDEEAESLQEKILAKIKTKFGLTLRE